MLASVNFPENTVIELIQIERKSIQFNNLFVERMLRQVYHQINPIPINQKSLFCVFLTTGEVSFFPLMENGNYSSVSI